MATPRPKRCLNTDWTDRPMFQEIYRAVLLVLSPIDYATAAQVRDDVLDTATNAAYYEDINRTCGALRALANHGLACRVIVPRDWQQGPLTGRYPTGFEPIPGSWLWAYSLTDLGVWVRDHYA